MLEQQHLQIKMNQEHKLKSLNLICIQFFRLAVAQMYRAALLLILQDELETFQMEKSEGSVQQVEETELLQPWGRTDLIIIKSWIKRAVKVDEFNVLILDEFHRFDHI